MGNPYGVSRIDGRRMYVKHVPNADKIRLNSGEQFDMRTENEVICPLMSGDIIVDGNGQKYVIVYNSLSKKYIAIGERGDYKNGISGEINKMAITKSCISEYKVFRNDAIIRKVYRATVSHFNRVYSDSEKIFDLDEYIKAEESKKNVELTLEQVAEKFNIPVENLSIVEKKK